MKQPFKPEPSSKLTFDWVFRQFTNISNFLNAEGGELHTSIIVFADTPYTVNDWDEVILVDASGGATEIVLQPGVDLRELYIKNIDATTTNSVTVTADTGEPDKVDFDASRPLIPEESIHIIYNETKSNWFILCAT